MSIKLHITDQRMLQLMEYCIANKVRDIDTNKAWSEAVGISHTNIFNIRKGTQQFTVAHIANACQFFNISADFIYGFTTEMVRVDKKRSPLDRIKEAVNELENELKPIKRVDFLAKKKLK